MPLAPTAARDTLRTLVHTDALEQFLADNFPATKVSVRAACLLRLLEVSLTVSRIAVSSSTVELFSLSWRSSALRADASCVATDSVWHAHPRCSFQPCSALASRAARHCYPGSGLWPPHQPLLECVALRCAKSCMDEGLLHLLKYPVVISSSGCCGWQLHRHVPTLVTVRHNKGSQWPGLPFTVKLGVLNEL